MKTSKPWHHSMMIGSGLVAIACLAAVSGCPTQTGDDGPTVTIIDGPFSLTEDMSLGGILEADSIDIPAGVTLDATDDLVIRSAGPVTIAGTIKGATLDHHGASITIESDGPIDLTGQLIAGSAPSTAETMVEGNALGADGGDGGSVSLISKSDITIAPEAQIVSGDAGNGGDAFAVMTGTGVTSKSTNPNDIRSQTTEGELTAQGGNGGKGGDIVIDADGVLRITPSVSGEPILILGNGGHGGDADAMVDAGVKVVTATIAVSGAGGESGFPSFAASSLEGLAFDEFEIDPFEEDGITYTVVRVLTGDSADIFGGGAGGNGGQAGGLQEQMTILMSKHTQFANPLAGPKEAGALQAAAPCPPTGGSPGTRDEDKGDPGANGFLFPGRGGSASAAAGDGTGVKRGGEAKATGGKGGNLKVFPFQLTLKGFGVPIGITVTPNQIAGAGGSAFARGGDGGPQGGPGGKAEAVGGEGGKAPFPESLVDILPVANQGGRGGNAEAVAGTGRNGVSCCDPPKTGQTGGEGGFAGAEAGKGGDGWVAGSGGDVIRAKGGNGGDGGDGMPPGFGGSKGGTLAVRGVKGDGLITSAIATDGQVLKDEPGTKGKDGSNCPAPTDGGTGVTPNRAPAVQPIVAVFDPEGQSTDYSVQATDPDNDTLTFSWWTPSCNPPLIFPFGGIGQTNVVRWFHPHPPCDPTTGHAAEKPTVTVSDGTWQVVCTYDKGASSGTGPACGAGTLIAQGN